MRYQFLIDNRVAAPMRETWDDAAWDAVNAGWAIWISSDQIKLDTNMGGAIERIP